MPTLARLALSRREEESISIGPDTRVTVKRVAGRKVHLLIEAPRDVRVMRTEIADEAPPPKPNSSTAAPPQTETREPAKAA